MPVFFRSMSNVPRMRFLEFYCNFPRIFLSDCRLFLNQNNLLINQLARITKNECPATWKKTSP
jgi:hypothetical protein